MPLSEVEIRQIQVLFNYSVKQLLPNSTLRNCIETVEQCDVKYGLNITGDVQANLVAIAEIDSKIDTIKTSNIDGLRRQRIDGEYEVEYKDNTDAAKGLKEQRHRLLNRIACDLNLQRKLYSGRKLRS